MTNELELLKEENKQLKADLAQLKGELAFLKTHPYMAQGIKGETLIVNAIQALATTRNASYDLTTSLGLRMEVKFSKVNNPNPPAATGRWSWSKPLGWQDKGKDFDFLVLIGEKDPRYGSQYIDASPYCFFLLEAAQVGDLMVKGGTIGGMIQLTTNFAKLRSGLSAQLLTKMISFEDLTTRFSFVAASEADPS